MDRLSKEQRSRNMSAVKGKDTKPELKVRSAIHGAGFRYSLHRSDLPGKPDLVLPKYRTVILVHGCFWHGHNCEKAKRPASNTEFWDKKLSKNIERDKKNEEKLKKVGWNVLIIWECELAKGIAHAIRFLEKKAGR